MKTTWTKTRLVCVLAFGITLLASGMADAQPALPLQVTIQPGTGSCLAENDAIVPEILIEKSTTDGSLLSCGAGVATAVLDQLTSVGGEIGPVPFSPGLSHNGLTVFDFSGHASATGVNGPFGSHGSTTGRIRVANRAILIDNPNPFDVGIVIDRMQWGEGITTAGIFGGPQYNDVLNHGTGAATLMVRYTLHSSPVGCHISNQQVGASFQGTVTDPLFLALVDNPNYSQLYENTTSVPCNGFPAVVPAFGEIRLEANQSSDAQSEIVGVAGVAAMSELEITTIVLADATISPTPSELVVTGHSPIALFITDPDGRRLGVDPSSLAFVNEITGGLYFRTPSAPQSLVIPMPLAGAYTVEVVGTGNGPYEVDVDVLDNQRNVLGHKSFSGSAQLNSHDAQTVSVSASGSVGGGDSTPPIVTVPLNQAIEATSAAGAAASFSVSAVDAVDGIRPVSCLPASGSTFPLGATTITCTATDLSGNAGTGSFSITVVDTTAPALTLPTTLTLEATSNAGAVATFAATATDLVDGARGVNCSPASGATFALGTTTVSCSGFDTRGNTASGTFAVVVRDTTAPLAACTLLDLGPDHGHRKDAAFFRASATDVVGPTNLALGPYSLANGEVVKLLESRSAGVVEVGRGKKSHVRRFRVGPGEARITARDGAGNAGGAACEIPGRRVVISSRDEDNRIVQGISNLSKR